MSKYIGTSGLRPQHDGRKSSHGKAAVQMWDTKLGTQYALKSYGTTVAAVTPASDRGAVPETYEAKVATGLLSATTLRHVKDGRQIDGAVREPVCRKGARNISAIYHKEW